MTIDDAIAFAKEWSRGVPVDGSVQGWRVVCAVLATEIDRLRAQQAPGDRGPWRAVPNASDMICIESGDFEHDVRLYVDGDFENDQQRFTYAEGIAAKLNAEQPAQGEACEHGTVPAGTTCEVCYSEWNSGRRGPPHPPLATPIAAPAPAVPDSWREVAEHLRHCATCAETDITDCFEGAQLWNRAAAPEVLS